MNIHNIIRIMEKLDFPKEAQEVFGSLADKILAKQNIYVEWEHLRKEYMSDEKSLSDVLVILKEFSEGLVEPNEYGADMLFLLDCAEVLEQRYQEKGIDSGILWDTLRDLKYKLHECMQVKGCCGTFVASWYDGFFKLGRFALGRLQFEKITAPNELVGYTEAGLEIKEGDVLINMHIPSGSPLTREGRRDAYMRAYEFFAEERRNGKMIFMCSSWLLYPPYIEVFGAKSNITDFAHDFTSIVRKDSEIFSDAWRVFGADADKVPNELPRKTRMQRALADWMISGGTFGYGIGVFVYPDAFNDGL